MKTALLGVNKALSQTLARKNIRVNAIAPGLLSIALLDVILLFSGVIRTDFSQMLWSDGPGKLDISNISLGRFGEADECASAVSFLVSVHECYGIVINFFQVSDSASYMSGEVIGVNGGMQARI